MGAAEGTKMDDDFVEMERVSGVWWMVWLIYCINSIAALCLENGHNVRAGRGVADEDERVPAAESNFACQDGRRQRW